MGRLSENVPEALASEQAHVELYETLASIYEAVDNTAGNGNQQEHGCDDEN